ncbi:MAG: amidohydrolase family protein [Planctomycetota bacterium]|jgi:predicted TIM-barrel fold metal-dependent hydrolase
MIVDCHTHLWRYPGELTDELVGEMAIARMKEFDPNVTPDQHTAAVSQVDRAIVFGLRAPYTGFLCENDTVAQYVTTDPDKLIGFGSVCPTEAGAVDEVHRASRELSLRGLKLSPTYGNWHPHEDRASAVFAAAETLGMPVIVHQATTFPRKARLALAHPLLLDDVAMTFPHLKMIVAHLGHPWEADTIVMIRKQPNVFADISALFYRPWQLYNSLRLAVEYGVTHKLLFGTDYPFTTFDETVAGLRDVVALSRDMHLPELPDDLPDQIIRRDTLALLGLTD